ncbi:MAG TPA: hypothetical protein VK842_00820 [bacterium]|jgi:hypothetical protein|nr:hypothetical protein [bacterium]
MRPRRWISLALLALALPLAADGPPAVAGQERLFDNGRGFTTLTQRLPIRCLDVPGLLGLGADAQAKILDHAAAAGFNAVSYEAPLFGPQGLCPSLGTVDENERQLWGRLLEGCALRQLWAFPVLYTPAAVDGLVGASTPRSVFFAGRNALGWQSWALHQASKVAVRGQGVTGTATVGGWLLYRGPWPDGPPINDRPAPATPTAEARLRTWAAWQVRLARRMGFRQDLGLDLYAKQDLGADTDTAQAQPEDPAAAPPAGAPVAALSAVTFSAQALTEQGDALDVLPPVPGAEKTEGLDDSASVPAAPASPWDLEGVDWPLVEDSFQSLPLASQVDFLCLTLDSQDWYRVGDRLAAAAKKAEVPVLWRQDWRGASPYERRKHLAAAPPLAGLMGPWPGDDWPSVGEALWPPRDQPSPGSAPFYVRDCRWEKDARGPLLVVQLSRPADFSLQWGGRPPLDHSASDHKAHGRPQVEHRLRLAGAEPGTWILVRGTAQAPQYGECLLRTRWMRVPR